MSDTEYRRHFFEESRSSREKIHDELFENMDLGKVVVDYGCGPGYLARVLARKAEKVFACDISSGTIACAGVINPADNLVYVTADEKGLTAVPDGSVDSVISINMVQHLKVAAYRKVLSFMSRMLKPGGKLVMHIQLSDPEWKTEEEWRSDKSVKGRMKYEFGIHCFSLSEEMHKSLVAEYGFEEIIVKPVASFTEHRFADIGDQHMLTATRL